MDYPDNMEKFISLQGLKEHVLIKPNVVRK